MQLATSYTTQMPSGLPSPTLTNPDMILPFDSPSSASNSKRAQRTPSPPPIDNVDQLHSADGNGPGEMKSAMRKLLPNGDGAKLRKPRHENGTLEKAKRSRNSRSPPAKGANGFQVFASTPTLKDNYAPPTTNAAASNGNDRSRWDRSSGVEDEDDSSPHSEGSQDGALDLGRPTYGFPSLDNEKDGFSAPPEMEDEDSYSHAAMSIRAEQILANAKKRLTVSPHQYSSLTSIILIKFRIWKGTSTVPEVLYTVGLRRRCPLTQIRVPRGSQYTHCHEKHHQ